MSFHNNPYFTNHHGYRRGLVTPPSPAPQFNFYAVPPPRHHQNDEYDFVPRHHGFGYGYNNLEEEERAALAHLRWIQQRREVAEAAAAREAAARARVQAEREAAIRTAIEKERQRELAAARAAYITKAAEQQRRARMQRQRQIQDAIAARQQHVRETRFTEDLRRRAECASRCAAGCPRRATKQQTESHQDEFKALNRVLGSLFGINLVEDETEAQIATDKPINKPAEPIKRVEENAEKVEKQKVEETKAPESSTSTPKADTAAFPEDINHLLSQFLGLRVEPTKDDAPATNNGVPVGLNEFLSRFGLIFEPLEWEDKKAENATAGPSVAKSTEAQPTEVIPVSKSDEKPTETDPKPQSTPSIEDTPLTDFLNGVTDLPPFVRDVLGNIEAAWKDQSARQSPCHRQNACSRDKGKGIAPGEKSAAPAPTPDVSTPATTAPTPASAPAPAPNSTPAIADTENSVNTTASISALDNIASELDLVRDSFTFPPSLSFGPSTADSAPNLLFNKVNSGYHTQANKLLQLLLAADGVSSGGDREVRKRRKEVVKAVEEEIEELERKRDQVWEEVKERRARGQESEDEVESTSSGSSVADREEQREFEHVEHVGHAEVEVAEKPSEENIAEAIEKSEVPETQIADGTHNVEGFDVPTSPAEVTETEPKSIPEQVNQPQPEPAQQEQQSEALKPEEKPAELIEGKREEKRIEPAEKHESKDDEFELL